MLKSVTAPGLSAVEIAVIEADKDMNALMISKQARQMLLDFGAFVGLMYFIYHVLNAALARYQEASCKSYLLRHLYPETEVRDVQVGCWKTTDAKLRADCHDKLDSGLTICAVLGSWKATEAHLGDAGALNQYTAQDQTVMLGSIELSDPATANGGGR